jgi:hypothetical protein
MISFSAELIKRCRLLYPHEFDSAENGHSEEISRQRHLIRQDITLRTIFGIRLIPEY